MRALGLLTALLVAGDPAIRPDPPHRRPESLPPLDEATMRAWRRWARREPDGAAGSLADARRDDNAIGARPRATATPTTRQD